ncbi:MAG: pyridoxal-phosphate dependent enzyme, partial [Chloroflexi bacterium]|nr:pyridoxal-phosphate dependent enzyme [Chloroflexota bacterium]
CAVNDDEIIAGMKLLAQTEGIFAEPTGGVVIASLKNLAASGMIKRHEVTVAAITGAGPRTQEVISDMVRSYTIQPNLESFEEVLGMKV